MHRGALAGVQTDLVTASAIILAAGYGSRLSERAASKPLAQVCGVSLIEIAVCQALAAGVTRVVVVTGHEAETLEQEVAGLARRLDADVRCVRLDDWSRPNGWSVLAGAEAVTSPYLLMMADHIFADGLLERLMQQALTDCDVVLAIDRTDNPLIDPEDATWVAFHADEGDGQTGPRRIARIGKTIEDFHAVDCGAFLANHELGVAILEAIADGLAGSLSEGMQVLANRGRAMTMDIGGLWWIDVDDPRAQDLAEAEAAKHLAILAGARCNAA